MRLIYSTLLYLLLPLAFLRLLLRSIKAPDYRKRWGERLGFFRAPQVMTDAIWFHAVSVGEAIAAIPLIKRVQAAHPGWTIVVTTMTPTGSAHVRRAFGNRVFHVYLPYDLPCSIKRFLNKIKPRIAVVMETELWPNLIRALHKREIPTLIANARLSERSCQGYSRFSKVSKQMMNEVSLILAQSQADGERFERLGLPSDHLRVIGNMKFDIELPGDIYERAQGLLQIIGKDRAIWIAASTHEGEDGLILSAHAQIKERCPNSLLVLVPRHPERFKTVAALCRQRGFQVISRSGGRQCEAETDVFLGDTMGELLLFYAISQIAFVGGSLVPTGGHNLLEPAALGLPVLTGPHTFNFAEISKLFLEAEAAMQVVSVEQLANTVVELLQDPVRCARMGGQGRDVITQNRGAVDRHYEVIAEYLH